LEDDDPRSVERKGTSELSLKGRAGFCFDTGGMENGI
jgi:hypothetical protein